MRGILAEARRLLRPIHLASYKSTHYLPRFLSFFVHQTTSYIVVALVPKLAVYPFCCVVSFIVAEPFTRNSELPLRHSNSRSSTTIRHRSTSSWDQKIFKTNQQWIEDCITEIDLLKTFEAALLQTTPDHYLGPLPKPSSLQVVTWVAVNGQRCSMVIAMELVSLPVTRRWTGLFYLLARTISKTRPDTSTNVDILGTRDYMG